MNKLLRKLSLGVVCLLMTAFICSCQSAQTGGTFEVGKNTFLLNGKPFVVKAAEVHYPRIPEPYWEQRILSCKALGMNTLCLYVFWNLHEQQPGKFDFSGIKILPNSAAWHRSMECTLLYVRVRMYVQNGKWVDCPGGC